MNNDWLDIAVLEDYLDGKLDAKTMNRVEREALDDPFVAEALAGLSASPKRSLDSLSILQKQLQERITQQQAVKKHSIITWQRLSIGSAAAVLFITAGIVFWMKQANYQKAVSGKQVEVALAPKPAVPQETIVEPEPLQKLNEAVAAAAQPRVTATNKIARSSSVAVVAANDTSMLTSVKVMDSLMASKNALSEVAVVRGYVKRQKESTTGATYVVAGKEVQDVPVGNVEQLLQGKVAGLKILNKRGAPANVFGDSTITDIAVSSATPVEGWDHFFMYLSNNNKFKSEPRLGKPVAITFEVDQAGNPVKLKVVKGISAKYNNEAKRLITTGPKWRPLVSDSVKVVLKVDF